MVINPTTIIERAEIIILCCGVFDAPEFLTYSKETSFSFLMGLCHMTGSTVSQICRFEM